MTAALLAALAGFFGIAIGRFWDSRSESDRWRRDQKAVSYQRLAERFDSLFRGIRASALSDAKSNTLQSIWSETHSRNWALWASAVADVWLHGSSEVVMTATALDRVLARLEYSTSPRSVTLREWKEARAPVHQAFERFLDSARQDLKLPHVPIEYFSDWVDPEEGTMPTRRQRLSTRISKPTRIRLRG